VNTLLIFLIVVGFFIIVQWPAAWARELMHRGLELLPSPFALPSGKPLAIETDPPCGDVTYVSHLNGLPTINISSNQINTAA
jgi:hypothetical protein